MLLSELFDYQSIQIEEDDEEVSSLQPRQEQQEPEPAGINVREEELEVLRELEELADGYDYFICETQLLHKSISVSQVFVYVHFDD